MFLIVSPHRCGSTKLAHELDSRSPYGCFSDPFHVSRARRICEAEDGNKWLSEVKPDGIKLVMSNKLGGWANQNHLKFSRVLILTRDPVDIAISLQMARDSDVWHNAEPPGGIPSIHVTDETIFIVASAWVYANTIKRQREAKGLPVLEMPFEYAIEESGAEMAAAWLDLPINPIKEMEPISSARGPSVHGRGICRNLPEVEEAFRGNSWQR